MFHDLDRRISRGENIEEIETTDLALHYISYSTFEVIEMTTDTEKMEKLLALIVWWRRSHYLSCCRLHKRKDRGIL